LSPCSFVGIISKEYPGSIFRTEEYAEQEKKQFCCMEGKPNTRAISSGTKKQQ